MVTALQILGIFTQFWWGSRQFAGAWLNILHKALYFNIAR